MSLESCGFCCKGQEWKAKLGVSVSPAAESWQRPQSYFKKKNLLSVFLLYHFPHLGQACFVCCSTTAGSLHPVDTLWSLGCVKDKQRLSARHQVYRVCVRRLTHHRDPDSRQRDDSMWANVEPEALWRCNGAKYYDALLGKDWLCPYLH